MWYNVRDTYQNFTGLYHDMRMKFLSLLNDEFSCSFSTQFCFCGQVCLGNRAGQQQYEEKNIRRRVYDALNVLMAMGIILKDKKDIQWKGLPCTSLDDVKDLKVNHLLSDLHSSLCMCFLSYCQVLIHEVDG